MPRVELAKFGRVFARWAPRFFRFGSGELRRESYRTLFMQVAPAAPVGHYPDTSPHPGKLRASLLGSTGRPRYADLPDRAGYTVPGIAEAEAGIRGHQPEEPIFITYAARTDGQKTGYAASIEAGLRTVRGRRYGSKQAPRGWVGIRARRLGRYMAGIAKRALLATVRRVRP